MKKQEDPRLLLSPLLRGDYLLSHFRSTIGVVRLNFSVRNGKRWNPHAIITLVSFSRPEGGFLAPRGLWWWRSHVTGTRAFLAKSCLSEARFSKLSWSSSRARWHTLAAEISLQQQRTARRLFFGGSLLCRCLDNFTLISCELLARTGKDFGWLVRLGWTCRHAYTYRLSTSSSTTTLREI